MPQPSAAKRRLSAQIHAWTKRMARRKPKPNRTDTHDERMDWTLADMRGFGGHPFREIPPALVRSSK